MGAAYLGHFLSPITGALNADFLIACRRQIRIIHLLRMTTATISGRADTGTDHYSCRKESDSPAREPQRNTQKGTALTVFHRDVNTTSLAGASLYR